MCLCRPVIYCAVSVVIPAINVHVVCFGEGKFSCTEGGLCVLDLKVPYQELLSVPGT